MNSKNELADKLKKEAEHFSGAQDLVEMLLDAEAMIRNLHTENTALRVAEDNLRAQIGQWEPVGVLDVLDNFEKKELSPFQAYLAADLVNKLRTALLASAPPAPQAKPQPLSADRDARIAELEQRNRDLYEDVQRFKEHALSEKDARMALEIELAEARKDAERWRFASWHIGLAWGEEGFTSLVRIVSDKHRALINEQVDMLMAGKMPKTRAAMKGTQ